MYKLGTKLEESTFISGCGLRKAGSMYTRTNMEEWKKSMNVKRVKAAP